MKKISIILLVSCLFISYVFGNNPTLVKAVDSNHNDFAEEIFVTKEGLNEKEVADDIEQQLSEQSKDTMQVDNVTLNDKEVVVKINNENANMDVEVTTNNDTEKTFLHLVSNNKDNKTFEVKIKDIESTQDYTMVFIDLDTGEKEEIKYNEASASVIPYIVYIVGAVAVRVTFTVVKKVVTKKVGSKVVKKTVKIKQITYKGKKYQEKTTSASIKATATYKTLSVKVGNGKTIKLTKERMQHVLQRHHLKYWTGKTKEKNDFFDPSLTVNDIKGGVAMVIQDNKSSIAKNLKTMKADEVKTAKGKYHGHNYVIEYTKSGKITTSYPN